MRVSSPSVHSRVQSTEHQGGAGTGKGAAAMVPEGSAVRGLRKGWRRRLHRCLAAELQGVQ